MFFYSFISHLYVFVITLALLYNNTFPFEIGMIDGKTEQKLLVLTAKL